jgi:hypothetical protein
VIGGNPLYSKQNFSGITAFSESRENDKVINVGRIWVPIAPDLDPNDSDMLSRGSLLNAVYEVIASLQTQGKEIPKGLAGIRKRIGEVPNTCSRSPQHKELLIPPSKTQTRIEPMVLTPTSFTEHKWTYAMLNSNSILPEFQIGHFAFRLWRSCRGSQIRPHLQNRHLSVWKMCLKRRRLAIRR